MDKIKRAESVITDILESMFMLDPDNDIKIGILCVLLARYGQAAWYDHKDLAMHGIEYIKAG